MVRRCFFKSIGSTIGRFFVAPGATSDRTLKYDYLQNSTVLGLFAMSSDADFAFLRAMGGIATEDEIAALVHRSKDALWALHKCFHGVATPPAPTSATTTSSTAGFTKRARKDFTSSEATGTPVFSEAQQRQEFFAKVAQLTAHPRLKEAQMKFDKSG
jgi:hypothetical protein